MLSSRSKKIIFLLLIIISALAVLVLAAYLVYAKVYDNKVYPGVKVGALDLGGQPMAEAEKMVKDKSQSLTGQGLKFSYQDRTVDIASTKSSFDMDLSTFLWDFDPTATAQNAYHVGRGDSFWPNLWQQINLWFRPEQISFVYHLNEDGLKSELREGFKDLENPVQDATLEVKAGKAGFFEFSVLPEKSGVVIDYDQALSDLKNILSQGDIKTISLTSHPEEPLIFSSEVQNVTSSAEVILTAAPLTLEYKATSSPRVFKWDIDKAKLASWLGLVKDPTVRVALADNKIAEFLDKEVAPEINREPARAKFEMKNGKVSNFQVSADGLKLNNQETIQKIKEHVAAMATSTIILAVDTISNEQAGAVDNVEFGIKEVVGTGHSNFAGSPKNRRHNIAVGAAAVNGILLQPGEEFSLVKTLGAVDASTGYLPELVIKENKTIPEYGGGLCQIGTTVFRAALESGLPITARRNHSYRVTYYEPAGMDAAIYIPNPDVRFINDTKDYILIQSRIEGNDIYFDFWGVKDSRQVTVSKPVVYNIVRPAATKIVETTDLAPGQKKCTEKAHNGADAYFDYTVVYNPGTPEEKKEEKRFTSHYVPWQEVCLVGVKQLSSDVGTATTTATSTPSN